ncbi:MAG TPA: DUF3857 domain-containing protein [Acidobacteriota bacterium]|nr:DUF3857 domain-containing protein [Acidobacteriota bacterium]HNT16615.1 DUF3857 domain-containing protein [Acidobacteriota bacterium]
MKRMCAVFLLVLMIASAPLFSQGFMDERAKEWAEKAYEQRDGAGSLAYLCSLYDLWGSAEYGSIQPGIEKIASSEDAHPMVAAKARSLLRFLLANQDRWKDAEAMAKREGFITDWMIIAPFGNEDKGGFDAVYAPEEKLDLSASARGIDRDVSWRRIPPCNYNGIAFLGNYVDPSSNATAYLASFIHSETERDAVIRCSFAGAHKIWLNRDLVASNPDYSPSAFDQFSYAIRLARGWNVILVKSCHAFSPWVARARLTDASGAPLRGFVSTSDPGRLAEGLKAVLRRPGLPSKGFRFFDPAEELEKAAASGGWEDSFRLGLYLYGVRSFDEKEHPDVDAMKSALGKEGAPLWINHFIGEAETDPNRKREAYEKSAEAFPSPESFLRLYYYYNRRGMTLPAVRYLDRALALRPEDPYLKAQKYAVLSGSLADGMAMREAEKLRERHQSNIPVLQTLIWMKDAAKDFAGREKLFRELLKMDYTEETAEGLFNLFAAQGRSSEAAALYGDYLSKIPYSRSVIYKLSSYLLDMGRPEEAEKTIGPFFEFAPDWPAGRELFGEILIARGETGKALEQFEKALLLNPQNDNLKRRLAFLKPDEELFYGAFRIPEGEIPAAGAGLEGEPLVILLHNTFVSVEPSGLSSRYVQFVTKVQDLTGVKAMSSFPITFDPDWQDVRVLDSSVTRPGGTKIRAQSYVTSSLSDPQYQLYYRNRQLVLTFPSLKEGDTVSIEYLLTDTSEANTFGHYFGDLVPFEETSPVMVKRYTLRVPDSLQVAYAPHKLDIEPSVIKAMGKTTWQWVRKDIPKSRPEAYSPGFGERSSYIHVSTFRSWEELGAWYSSFIRDQWELGSEAKAVVSNLTTDKSSVMDKVKAVHGWVVGQTRYVGLEFGVHGYKPYKARRIFERRFGDCKDKAILLCSMLREAGVEASMALIRTRNLGKVEKSPASLATFNHAICYVPEADLFLDGTAEYSGIAEIPHLDQDCDVLVVNHDGTARVRAIPLKEASANSYEAEYSFDIRKGEKSAAMKGSLKVRGQEASDVRSNFKNPDKQKERLEKQLSYSYPGSRITGASFSDMSDINSDPSISFEGAVSDLSKPAGEDAATLPLWMGASGIFSGYCALTERTTDLVLPYPSVQSHTLTYSLQPGTKADLPGAEALETEFGSFRREVSRNGDSVTVTSSAVLSTARVSTEDYPKFRDFAINVDKLISERMKIQW